MAFLVISYYRHFHYAFGNSLKNANDILEDGLKHSTEFVEALYQNWFLRELTACWTNAAAEDLAALGYVSEIEKQRDFYKRYVVPASSKNTRAFVIISDALRYHRQPKPRNLSMRQEKQQWDHAAQRGRDASEQRRA